MRSSRIHFPITSIVKHGGDTYEYVLNKGDIVKCFYCNDRITISQKVIVIPDMYNNTAVRCPNCGKVVSVLYYYDKIIGKEK